MECDARVLFESSQKSLLPSVIPSEHRSRRGSPSIGGDAHTAFGLGMTEGTGGDAHTAFGLGMTEGGE